MVLSVKLFFALSASLLVIVSAQTGLCPAPNGDFPNPSSELCTTFFRCFQGNPSLVRCPANQRFDFLFRTCRPQGSVNCNSQLEVYAAPAITSGIGGLGAELAPFVGTGGLGGLGAATGLGAGLPDRGLISLLSQLDESDGEGQNGNNGLATLFMLSALLNQRNSVNQQDNTVGSIPFNQLYPVYNQMSLNSFPEPQGQPTSQNYQQAGDNYDTERTPLNSDTGMVVGDGATFIFVPQYAPVQGQPQLPQGQGNVALPWSEDTAGKSQSDGIFPGVNQSQNALQGQDRQQGQGVFQGQSELRGQSVVRGRGALQGHGFLRRRGQGQRQNVQTQLQNLLSEPSGSFDFNSGNTFGSAGFSDVFQK